MKRLHKFVLNLYFIFTGIFIILDEPVMILLYWCISWLLYIFVDFFYGGNNGKND